MKENGLKDNETALSANAVKVLERRYLAKDDAGKTIETPVQLFRRVARNISQADAFFAPNTDLTAVEDEFFRMMASLEFLPNSPTLMNAGKELQQLSACFVLPIEDSMDSIFETVKDTALIHKSGGGTGFSFSRLRPVGSRVKSTSGVSSGPVSFMRVFDAATESVKQGGTRRGANMGILRVDHPDIMDFISCKAEGTSFTNFNISVAITDSFMTALMEEGEYDLIDPYTKAPTGKLNAEDVMEKIVHYAWKNGDPGIIFIDRINRDNPTPHVGEIESTNPCGEQPLLPYESCNLGSINLPKFVKGGELDWAGLERIVHSAVHFLDNVIDMNRYPITKIEQMTKGNRKIGLGVMGFADMLIMLGIPYNSEAAVDMAEKVMHFINTESKKASQKLSEKRGAFPKFKGSTYDKPGAQKLRNATTTTIAPTGTISIIAGVSSGIEPLFAISYIRTVMDNDKLVEVHPLFEQVAREKGFYSAELMQSIAQKGTAHGLKEVPEEVANVFVTSHEISPEWHIRMQAAFQKHTDNAVSKTVNFENSATEIDVEKAYMLSYDLGCKGVTIYRDGSREGQVLSTGKTGESKKPAETAAEAHKLTPKPRPHVVRGSTQRLTTGCGKIYITVNEDEKGNPFEMFVQIGKAGGCAASQTESIGRLVSLAMRSGIDANELVKQLIGVSCHQPAWDNGGKVLSCADAIGKALSRVVKKDFSGENPKAKSANGNGNGNGNGHGHYDPTISIGACPDCGGSLEYAEGCMTCRGCGYSKCS
ncbi:MAG: vitamin B12-dependent ribonucleotide reductase [Nitrospinae bacterium]|nr:vitamin B12-dependent ribonucleotide reductase [Nitrospinota bacterium]